MSLLLTNIRQLINVRENTQVLHGASLSELPVIENAFLLADDGVIVNYGSMDDLVHADYAFDEVMDVTGKLVLPCWCDSHTHIVFAGSRENEFVDKIKGLGYAEIAAKGGGILNSAKKLQQTPEEELYEIAAQRLKSLIHLGTGAIEIKSGYGLTLEAELKMLRVIQQLKKDFPIPVKATFLGAHAIPEIYANDREAYIQLIIEKMLPAIAKDKLADYIDVFCEKGFFTVEETERICKAGINFGLKPKIHANQLHVSGGVEVGVKLNAVSVDHLESMDEQAIQSLSASNTIGTLLPTAAFFLRMPYQPARDLIKANCAIALASDFNPGSSPSGNMNFVVSLSCIQMKMLPEEAINAATVNGAYAMEIGDIAGSITKGKKANFIVTQPISSYHYLPYAFGTNCIEQVFIEGKSFK